MKPKFSHDIVNSFFLWYDNFLMKKSDAYKTYTTKFYNYQDARLGGGKVVYGSPYKQWVYDKIKENNISVPEVWDRKCSSC